jgi:ABC-type polysaccharide/polyol phosphate export permease
LNPGEKALRVSVLLAAGIAAFGAAIHLAAIVGGPSWYAYFGAPPSIVASARDGTWLAPVSAAMIAGLMALCALYACSAVRLIPRLPLLRPALASMAAVCLIRGFALIPLSFKYPELINTFEVVAAIIWSTAGVGFAAGFWAARSVLSIERIIRGNT